MASLTFVDVNKTELSQGDVLERTPALNRLLEEVHPHFHRSQKNLLFMVLTQSCDLAIRNDEGCKAPYIILAPVRSLDWLVSKRIREFASTVIAGSLPVVASKNKAKIQEFLTRLLNNNEPGFFYLDSGESGLAEDCVAVLGVSIALKAEVHYDMCLESKVSQLNDTFQAKLGWLIGQLYSRVGTEDRPKADNDKKIKDLLSGAAIWMADRKVKDVENAYSLAVSQSSCHPNRISPKVISDQEINKAAAAIPSRREEVLEEISKVLAANLDEDRAKLIRKKIQTNQLINALLLD